MAAQKSPAPALLQIVSSLQRTEVRFIPRNLRALALTIFANHHILTFCNYENLRRFAPRNDVTNEFLVAANIHMVCQ